MKITIQKLFTKNSLLLLFLLLLMDNDATAQSRYPSMLLGTDGLQELATAPQFPNSEFVAVQFCGLRRKGAFTQYYVEQIRNQGIDIKFFAVLDNVQEGLNPTLDNFEHQVVTDWGMHPSAEAANQVYILNQERKVVYQGTLTNLDGNILKLLSQGGSKHQEFGSLVKILSKDPQISQGIWLYDNKVYPLGMSLGELIAANHRTTKVLYSENTGKLTLPVIDYVDQKVIAGFIAKLGKSIVRVDDKIYSIKITNANLAADDPRTSSWSALLLNVDVTDGILIENFGEIQEALSKYPVQATKVERTPAEILEVMRTIGIRYEINSTEAVKLIKIQ